MSEKKEKVREKRSSSSRRCFLKVSLAGVGALAWPSLGSAEGEAAARTQRGQGVPRRGGAEIAETTSQDNWAEPWEWRPSDWPGQQLHLNVVKHAAPKAVFGDADTADSDTFLFSYNGTSPGPTIRMRGDETLFLKVRNLLEPNQDFCLPAHTNGKHQVHTTNLHTHGLHVETGRNPDDTFSDNVFLRIIPQGDYDSRRAAQSPDCWPLGSNEVAGEANFELRLGELGEPHPPGTHWYHPHAHGATFTQVASGMAGFLIVEGDVDDALKRHFDPHPDDRNRVGAYRERLIFVQRIFAPRPADPEGFASPDGVHRGKSQLAFPVVNGESIEPRVMVMRPGAVERWRVLNGSVDGRGYIEFMVVEGDRATEEVLNDATKRQTLRHLAMDGITFVTNELNPRYTTRRVTSLVMAPANRADFLFKAPRLAGADQRVFTVVAKYYPDATDEDAFQDQSDPDSTAAPDVVIATLIVREAQDENDNSLPPLEDISLDAIDFPPVPRILHPVSDDELVIPKEEAERRGAPEEAGLCRKRQVKYSGWGIATFPDGDKTRETMKIDGAKFNPDVVGHKMLLGTAEEWTVWNCTQTIWDNDPTKTSGDKITTKAADHPFHIHINPFWVMSIKDGNGREVLDQPRWQDSVRLPRNGGRVIFRARFWDYAGQYVNHCHILMHEDNGMMQTVEVVADPRFADYKAESREYQWPQPSRRECYEENLSEAE